MERRVLGNMYGLVANKYNGFNWDYWQVRAVCGFGVEDFPTNIKPDGCYGFKGMYAKENGILLDEVIDDQLVEKAIYKKENIKKEIKSKIKYYYLILIIIIIILVIGIAILLYLLVILL